MCYVRITFIYEDEKSVATSSGNLPAIKAYEEDIGLRPQILPQIEFQFSLKVIPKQLDMLRPVMTIRDIKCV